MNGLKDYRRTRFSAALFTDVFEFFVTNLEALEQKGLADRNMKFHPTNDSLGAWWTFTGEITRNDETWEYQSLDDFVHEYAQGYDEFTFYMHWYTQIPGQDRQHYGQISIMSRNPTDTLVRVYMPTVDLASRILRKCDANADIPGNKVAPPKPKVFIGHGGAGDWKDLKNDLQDKFGVDVIAFETGARAGHAIRDIIADLHQQADFALLVMTAEDEQADGTFHARQNVIHEAGLFQGKLGYTRALMLVEDGVQNFSNVQGIVYLKFHKGEISSLLGEIIATLRREGLY